jgi:hypothetical protein
MASVGTAPRRVARKKHANRAAGCRTGAGMTQGHASKADVVMLDRLKREGVTVRGNPITLEQLQTWRPRDLSDDFVSRSLGSSGTESVYGPTAFVQISEIAEMLTVTRNLDVVTVWVFGMGRNPNELALRDAYTR